MKKLILQALFLFLCFGANAQLAYLELVSPNPIPQPMAPGVAKNFLFKYVYLPNQAIGIDPSSVVVTFPSGAATATVGASSGQYISIVITPTAGPFVIKVTASGAGSPANGMGEYTSSPLQLPISLTRFEGSVKSSSVNLAWSTASEMNNEMFSIERSFDGKNFSEISELRGAGNSSTNVEYSIEDKTVYGMASANTVYYRLKQTDRDGQSSYASTVAVQLNKKGTAAVTNVIADNVYFEAAAEGDVTISILDLNGRTISSKVVAATAGYNQVEMDFATATSGMYIVTLNNGEKITTKKIVR